MEILKHSFQYLVSICWLVFIVYWLVSAKDVKKNVSGNNMWSHDAWVRIIVAIVILILVSIPDSRRFLGSYLNSDISSNFWIQSLGVIICASGIGFAIWARRHLGKNWSGTPSIKEGHEFITSGPYQYVRHPIYTGIIAAFIGSSIVIGAIWLFIFFIASINFVMRIKVEEGYMMKLFPDQYPEYKKRTKALIPFIW